ncbi:DUF4013 domain-containing protein [Methanoregula sp.]|jgi:hypothetical protein|uniref:DUF4013 domain-containing protein n=1 Tax=Methanoregula sp. TaxID=2052170 RepID=UPI003C15DC36
MHFETIINESVNFTRDTLLGNPIRWLIFVILGLPGGLLPFVLNIKDMTANKSAFHWELIHWDQVAVLGILMLVASFFLSGYIVRIYRGGATPPAFNQWAGLLFDGIKLCIVWLIWMLPALILMLAAFATIFGAVSMKGNSAAGLGLLAVMLILLLAAMILVLAAIVLGTIGAIRFARMGRIMEGLNYHEILATIVRIGWWDYIIAGIILCVIALIFSIITGILGLVPFIGWILDLIVAPLITVMSARFLSQVYDAGMPPAPAS